MYTDSTGQSWESFWNDVGNWINEKIVNPTGLFLVNSAFTIVDTIFPNNDINVIAFEKIYFAGCGVEVSVMSGFCFDREGNFAIFESIGGGGDLGCGISVGRGISTSNAPTVYDFLGYQLNIGGSIGIPIAGPISVGPGYDWSISIDTGYTTNTYSINVGLGRIPFEMHGSLSNSWARYIHSFNGD